MATEITLAGFPLQTTDKVRYADTDRQGHVNNAVFSTFLETGRVELLYSTSCPLSDAASEFVIVKLSLEFRAEIRWPGTVQIGTRVASISRSSVTLEQAVFQGEQCAAVAETVIVLIDGQTRRSTPLSVEAVAKLRRAMGNP
ncbi:acyl-CoA thioesterase [Pseudomonas brenneri]